MSILDQIYEKAKQNPQRVAFPEAENEKMMRAAYETGKDGYIIPILVGDAQKLQALSEERGYDSSVFCFVDIQEEEYKNKLIGMYVAQPGRFLKEKALARRMQDPLYYAMVMQAVEEAEVTFAGIDNTTGDVLLAGQMIIGMQPGSARSPVSDSAIFRDLRAAREVFWQWETARYAPIRMQNSLQALRSPHATQ